MTGTLMYLIINFGGVDVILCDSYRFNNRN